MCTCCLIVCSSEVHLQPQLFTMRGQLSAEEVRLLMWQVRSCGLGRSFGAVVWRNLQQSTAPRPRCASCMKSGGMCSALCSSVVASAGCVEIILVAEVPPCQWPHVQDGLIPSRVGGPAPSSPSACRRCNTSPRLRSGCEHISLLLLIVASIVLAADAACGDVPTPAGRVAPRPEEQQRAHVAHVRPAHHQGALQHAPARLQHTYGVYAQWRLSEPAAAKTAAACHTL